jgi:hypothetical protein
MNFDTSLKHYVWDRSVTLVSVTLTTSQQDNHWGEKKAPAKKRAPVHLFLKEREKGNSWILALFVVQNCRLWPRLPNASRLAWRTRAGQRAAGASNGRVNETSIGGVTEGNGTESRETRWKRWSVLVWGSGKGLLRRRSIRRTSGQLTRSGPPWLYAGLAGWQAGPACRRSVPLVDVSALGFFFIYIISSYLLVHFH